MNKTNNNYTGWFKWYPTDNEWAELYANKTLPNYVDLLENEYLLTYDKNNELIGVYCWEESELRKVSRGSINVGKKKKEENKIIYPRNDEQICAIDMLLDNSKTVKLLTGKFGSGKDLLMASASLKLLRLGDYDKIIWVRNNVDVKDTVPLGALPGEMLDKMLPFLGPFIDHVGEEEVKSMITNGNLEVQPLQFIRGRNFTRSIIMCSEAENLTLSHIQLILARAAEGSIVMFNADTKQRDKSVFEKSKGIEMLIDRLKGNKLFGFVQLEKGERSETASLADLLD